MSSFKSAARQGVLPSLAVLAIALHAASAAAQTTQAEAKTAAASENAAPGDIVVTANKTGAQSIQQIPLNISAVGGGQLAKSGSTSIDDVMRQIPGVTVSGSTSNKTIIIRGLAAQTGAAMVGLYLDEALLPPASAPGVAQSDPPIYDISRVEVLRGPQGTLYGAGSVGGTVRYITNQPNLTKIEGVINAQAGARASNGGGSYRGDIMFNLPLIADKLGVRVVAWERQVDGFVTNTALNRQHTDRENTYGGRAEVLLQATDTTKITGTFQFQSTNLADSSHVFVGGNFRTNPVLEPFYDKLWIGNLTGEQKLGFGTLTLTGSHVVRHSSLNLDQSQFLPPNAANLAVFLPSQFASYNLKSGVINRIAEVADDVAELRFTSQFNLPFQINTGLFYDKTNNTTDLDGRYIDPGTGNPYGAVPLWYQVHSVGTAKNQAAFFNATWNITDQFIAEGGIRYYKLAQTNSTNVINPYFGTTTGYQPFASSQQTGTVKKAQLTYKPSNHILTYAVYSQGFRQGGSNTLFPGTTTIQPQYNPDFVTNYEIGFKTELVDRQVILNGAVYHMNWNGIQTLQHDSTGAYSFTSNGGKANFNGIELETRINPRMLPGFSASLNGRYSDQKLAIDNPAVTTYAGLKGQQIPYSTKLGFSAGLDQKFTLIDLPAYVHADASYTGRGYTAFDPRDPTYRPIGNYTIVNLRAGFEQDNWHAALYAKNVGNTRGFNSWRVESSPGIPDRVDVTPPREVGIDVGYKF